MTFSNPGGMYMKVRAYVWDGTDWEPYIKDQNMGNGTSGTFTFDSGDLADIYTQLGNNLQASCKFRVYSYTGSDYSSGYVGYKDKDGIAYINQTTNKPTFTDFDVANYDKSIAVKDKYDNTLTTSSTSTLLGSNDKVIKGYSKLRGTVAVADKMIPLNGATGIKYRFATATQYAEGAYSAVADVNMDLDNVITKDVSITAYDSRGLTTTVNKSLSYLAEYAPVSLWGLTLVRDNGVDSETKLQISGSFWKQYFGGGTSGVQNSVTAHWRYKPTGDSWASQTWNSITLTDDGSGNLSYDDYIDGDLGASGFDTEASFDIEVRIYDKLTATIVEQTLSVGTPVIDITKDGVSFGARYDADEGGPIQEKGVRVNPVGVIQMYANATVPSGWLECNGQAISRIDYADLFDIIGTTYGSGNGSTTFNVPNFSGKLPVGFNSSDSNFDAMGETGGAKTVNLQHSHTDSGHTHGSGSYKSAGGAVNNNTSSYGYQAASPIGVGYTYAPSGSKVSISNINHATPVYGTSSSGGASIGNALSTSQSILPPYLTLKFIIKY